MAERRFTWVPLFEELATALVPWRNRQDELVSFLEDLRADGLTITPLSDRDATGARFTVEVMDPFTFLGVVNRGIRDEQRLQILARMKKHFSLEAPMPSDLDGIPLLHNMRSWFFRWKHERQPGDVERLWALFDHALREGPLDSDAFTEALDAALALPYVNVNLTMALFWIRPRVFLTLDQNVRRYLGIKLPSQGLNAEYYGDTVRDFLRAGRSPLDVSYEAWAAPRDLPSAPAESEEGAPVQHWLVGAYWSASDPQDQTERFVSNGIWENGYEDRYLDEVRSIQVGDRIGIKTTTTQRLGLPFNPGNHTVSKMTIKAIGTVVGNRGDGCHLEVEWEPDIEPREWFFYTYKHMVWRIRADPEYQMLDFAKRLIAFVWHGADQDYDWFLKRWYGSPGQPPTEPPGAAPYSVDDIVTDGVFLSEAKLESMLSRIRTKKAVILQGPPGVGKTFLARRLAFALMEERAPERVRMIQFHQSYAYEDFIRGYRPSPSARGGFELQDGVFLTFCERARQQPEDDFVFIIDEINRGNLSQIFGELLMLIEADKRGPGYALPLVYRRPDEAEFFVPPNVHILGLMNLADRSLAMVDYAIRRRFAFIDLEPQYDSDVYRTWLTDRGMGEPFVDRIVRRMTELNETIASDPLLGRNYCVGHSFFCPRGDDFSTLGQAWVDGIIENEIVPLLREYWFDDAPRADAAIEALHRS